MALFFWSVNNFMNIKIYTLLDITETKEIRDKESKSFKQQANYNSILQTAFIRSNFVPLGVVIQSENINKLNFGSAYKNKQTYWSLILETERESTVISMEMLLNDFNLVPIILDLDETVNIKDPILLTTDSEYKNIFFELE